jgi:hypothetical protein
VTEFKQLIERTTVPALQLQAKRKTLQECLSKPEAVPQESDILEFLYMAKKPKDVDLLIEAVNRYRFIFIFLIFIDAEIKFNIFFNFIQADIRCITCSDTKINL